MNKLPISPRVRFLSLFLLSLPLVGCGLNNHYLAENSYLSAQQTQGLKVPDNLKAQTELTPMYDVPEGKFASPAEPKVSAFPPRIKNS